MCECIEVSNSEEAKVEFARQLVIGDTESALGIAQSVWVFFKREEEFSGYVARMSKMAEALLPLEVASSLKLHLQQLRFHTSEELLAVA